MARLEQFRQRIAIHYHIGPLSEEETKKYILHRLNYARSNGREMSSLFEREALELVYRYSRGLPRLINKVCDHTLFIGFVSDLDQIKASTVQEAIDELRFREDKKYEQIFQST